MSEITSRLPTKHFHGFWEFKLLSSYSCSKHRLNRDSQIK